MSDQQKETPLHSDNLDRRTFIGAAAAAAGVLFLHPSLVRGTAANSAVRVGLLGCGGRGTEDATNLIDTGGARVVALADMFQDRLDEARANFDKVQSAKGYAPIDAKQLFLGPKAFEAIAASKEVDAIVIATPAYYHPQHLEAAVAGGKHIYLEKPVAVDVPGALKVAEIGKRANGKLSLDVGFQIRECPPFVEMVRRIHAGALGTIICGEAHYWSGYNQKPAWPNASPAERRLRNWGHDRILSGDIIVEQNIHAVDICNWILKSHPLKAVATGGRKERPAEGDTCYGHFNGVFYYPDDVTVSFSSAQFIKGGFDVNERFFGTKGSSQSPYSGPLGIWGDEPWQPDAAAPKPGESGFSVTGKFGDNLEFADSAKKKSFIDSITSGNFHNQAADGTESVLSCILMRTSAYKGGHEMKWEEIIKSKEVWDPKIDLNKLS